MTFLKRIEEAINNGMNHNFYHGRHEVAVPFSDLIELMRQFERADQELREMHNRKMKEE